MKKHGHKSKFKHFTTGAALALLVIAAAPAGADYFAQVTGSFEGDGTISTPPPTTFTPTPFSNSSEPSVPSTAPHGIPSIGYTKPELPCDPYLPRTEIKDKKKITKLTKQLKKLKGTWQFTGAAYFSRCLEGQYKLETKTDAGNENAEPFTVTFQGNGFCTNYYEDPINGGPWCEKPTHFYTDGTFGDLRGGQAFMKLNKSKPEFYGAGKGGYEKFILKKVSKTVF